MKRILCVLLVLVASMLVCFPSCAEEPAALNLTQAHAYETATSLCFIEDTLYMLGAYGVYAYKDNELSTVINLSDANMFRYQQERPEDEEAALAWERAISRLFTDGKTLYGLHPYSGQIFEIVGGKLSACAALPGDTLYVDDQQLFREVKGAVFEGGTLFLLLGTDDYEDYEKTEVIAFDWASQSCEALPIEGVQSIAAGAEGKLLVFVQSDENAIWQLDAASRTLETELANFGENSAPAGLACYDQKPVYYKENRVILAQDAEHNLVKAYLPVTYSFGATQAACSKDGIYAYPDSNYVFLRDISIEGEASQKVLTLMGNVSPTLMVDFSIEHPDIAVVSVQSLNTNELRQAAISGDSSVDLFVLSAPGVFAAMKEKGYIGALNGNEALIADARTLYPALQEVIFDSDALMGYPMSITPQSWTINETQWKRLELGEYPATYDELFEKIALWLDKYASDYPEYTLSDLQQMGADSLVFAIVEAYVAQMESSGENVKFDTPAFRSLLQSVSEHLDLFSEDHDQWGMPLLSSYNQGFGTSYADQDLMCMVAPPAIEAGKEQALMASLNILCVNAVSKQTEEAATFIAYCAGHLTNATRCALHPNLNDPVESATYKSRVATLQEEVEALKARMETADDDKKIELEDEIAQKQATIEYVSENKWDISPESIEVYRSVAQNMVVPYRSSLLSKEAGGGYDALRSVVTQYCAEGLGTGDIEALIAELDRVATMISMENM